MIGNGLWRRRVAEHALATFIEPTPSPGSLHPGAYAQQTSTYDSRKQTPHSELLVDPMRGFSVHPQGVRAHAGLTDEKTRVIGLAGAPGVAAPV